MVVREQILQWIKEKDAPRIYDLYQYPSSPQNVSLVAEQNNGEGEASFLTLLFKFEGQPDLLVTLEGCYDSFDGTSWNDVFVSESYTHTETRYRKVVLDDPYTHTETRYRKAQ